MATREEELELLPPSRGDEKATQDWPRVEPPEPGSWCEANASADDLELRIESQEGPHGGDVRVTIANRSGSCRVLAGAHRVGTLVWLIEDEEETAPRPVPAFSVQRCVGST